MNARRRWITRGVIGIVTATFFSDVAHEMATAVLPLYLGSVGLGAAALGAVEGFADLVYSLSKLAGGVLGQRAVHKKPWVAAGYAITAVGTASIGLAHSVVAVVSLRGAAWIGRGFRSPMRDFLLADEVEPTHFGRAYGIERAADMLGALVGPLVAIALIAFGWPARQVILWSLIPAAIPVIAILVLTRDRAASRTSTASAASAKDHSPSSATADKPRIPPVFWRFLPGVLIFGLGDFSRTFLILLAARALGDGGQSKPATLSIAVLLYALHNGISALAAYPIGKLGDRTSKLRLLTWGYALGVATNILLAFTTGSFFWLVVAVVMSGIYIAAEETLEKAAAAHFLPRESRSLGLGILASANAVGDMVSSVALGLLLDSGHGPLGFGLAAGAGAVGVAWMAAFARRHAAV
jgi:MFS family permease